MSKYFAGLIILVITLFALEWFGMIDIPYVDLPDLTAGKEGLLHQTMDAADEMG